MIILDTCVLIFDALSPEKLSSAAKKSITQAEKNEKLFCCGISLWEIGMLINKKRLDPGTDSETFLRLTLQAREIQVLSINVEIAALASTYPEFNHSDPADRLIAATAIHYDADIITCDKQLSKLSSLSTIW